MPPPDLLDRLLDHGAWTTARVLVLAGHIEERALDQLFDLGHGSFRATAVHMVSNLETWSDLLAGRAVRRHEAPAPSLDELTPRFADAYADFAAIARAARDSGRLAMTYLDTLDEPPRPKSVAGTLLHVLTHDHLHRGELLHMLARLGVPDLIEGDVLSWEAATAPPPAG